MDQVYSQCPNCSVTTPGMTIVRCSKCGALYCPNCTKFVNKPFYDERCPKCNQHSDDIISGHIRYPNEK